MAIIRITSMLLRLPRVEPEAHHASVGVIPLLPKRSRSASNNIQHPALSNKQSSSVEFSVLRIIKHCSISDNDEQQSAASLSESVPGCEP